ncbi:MAG: molybdopterin cofactor-binding domain-containing protein [Casimicrobium sp.]
MYLEKALAKQGIDLNAIALGSKQNASRRTFMKMSLGGAAGIAVVPSISFAQNAQAPAPKPGQKPTEQPAAFVTIAKDGTTTILCNRMDMGQGIETALAMICAEELEADWSKVKTAFGNQKGNYVDPAMGMHLTGGSNSVKNSYTQYRELGARTKVMLVTAAAKQWKVDAASLKAENGFVVSGSRRASYGELFDAAMKEPIPETVALKDPKTFKIIGKPTGLKVSRAKSTGTQPYGIDVKLPGMLTAVVMRPPVFGGKVKSFDAAAAMKVKGVRAVLPVDLDRGAKGIAVIADAYWPAKMGRDAVKVEWDSASVGKADTTAMLTQYRELAKAQGNVAPADHFKADVSKLASAPNKLSAEFVFPYLNHAQMEPLACTIDLKANECHVYTASQMPGVDAATLAKVTELKPEQINIHVQMAGGGFGRRAVPTSEYLVESANVAKAYIASGKRAPIKVVHSREDDLKAGYYRPFTLHRAEIGYDNDGKIVAWDHRIVSQSIVKGSPFESFLLKEGVDGTTTEGMREPYEIPMRLGVHHPDVNVPVLWWRSVGSTHTAFVMETLLDEIAVATKKDPVAYRMSLLADDARGKRHKAALQLAVDKSGYGKKKLAAGMHWGVAMHESFESVVAFVLEAGMKDGKPVIGEVTAAVHCNFCVNPRTVEAQVQGSALMALATTMENHAITFKDGVVQQNNFHDFPMPRITDMPKIAVHIVPSNDPPKGIGEPGLPPFAPALANALRRATGKPLREMPFKLA